MSPVEKASVEELIEICTNIFDQSLRHTLSPTSMVWEIVGATELLDLRIDRNGKVQLVLDVTPIEVLPRDTGLTIESILQIFKENRNLFDFVKLKYGSCEFVTFYIHISYRKFLKNEVRSKDLHFKYRNSVLHSLKSRITYIKKLRSAELCVAFSSLEFMVNAVPYWF